MHNIKKDTDITSDSSVADKKDKKPKKKLKIIKPIGNGSYGKVYLGNFNGSTVAIKREKSENNTIRAEYIIYRALWGKKSTSLFIPQIFGYYKNKKYRYLVMQLLGRTLDDMVEKSKTFDLKTTVTFAIKMLDLIEQFHKCGFIYRDIKPENFALELNSYDDVNSASMSNPVVNNTANYYNRKLYLFDFGLSKLWKKTNTFKKKGFFIGTIRYASIYAHYRMELSFRDDLESLCYVWLYFLNGSLPWQGLRKNDMDSDEHIKEVLKIKKEVKEKDNFKKHFDSKKVPIEFYDILSYIQSLEFNKTPDYQKIRATLSGLIL